MVAREFQSYISKRKCGFHECRRRRRCSRAVEEGNTGTRCSKAEKTNSRGRFRVAIQRKLSKMPPPPGRRVAAPENPLRRKISLCHLVETDYQDAAAAWKEENEGYQSDQLHCGGEARSGIRRGCGEIVASEDFASFLIYPFVRSSFSPLGFILSSALPGICVYVQFYLVLAEWVPHHYSHSS